MTAPLTDQQFAAIEAGRAAVRARFAGGAFPAALGQAIADELADAAMAPALAEVTRLRAELAQARTAMAAARAVTVHIDEYGDMVVYARDVNAALATAPADPCLAEPVHQAGCPAA